MSNRENFTSCTIRPHQCNCFEKLTEAERERLKANTVTINYKKGEIVCKKGAFASHVMFVNKGLLKIFLESGDNTLVLRIIPDGNLVGLTSTNDKNGTFQYSASAYIDTEIDQINIEFFNELLRTNPEFSKEVIDILTSDSVLVNGRFFCLTHKQSYGRLADIILCLSDRIFKSGHFDLPLSRKELAELSGMSVETVVRMLNVFKKEGIVEQKGKTFKVLDYERLKHICENG